MIAFALLMIPARAFAQDVGLDLGTIPARVQIEDLNGASVDLSQYVGRTPVVFEFWATWCPICQALAPRLDAVAKKYKGKAEVVVIAVGVSQTPRSIKRHMEKHALPGRVLWDGGGRATRAFMAPSTSYIVVLDRKGRVVYTGTGEEQNLDAAVAKAIAAK